MKVVATILALLIVLSSIICVAKSGNTRVCGSRLIKQVIHICNGCIAGTFVEEVEKRKCNEKLLYYFSLERKITLAFNHR